MSSFAGHNFERFHSIELYAYVHNCICSTFLFIYFAAYYACMYECICGFDLYRASYLRMRKRPFSAVK